LLIIKTLDRDFEAKNLRRLISKKKMSKSITHKKPPKAKKEALQILKHPKISKLAPYSASLVASKIRGVSQRAPANSSYSGAGGNPTSLKSIAEKKTILKEIQNLSEALMDQHHKFELAVERIKDERKKHKKTKRHLEKSELKKDHIEYLKKRIDDLKRTEENLLQDL
jgi:hypothetical protein